MKSLILSIVSILIVSTYISLPTCLSGATVLPFLVRSRIVASADSIGLVHVYEALLT
ncbi:hypothetical protein [Legionella nagasakiensis]|uniref:hypothetical protein n=1 Tax=Legionella nagasakiensis TaxID=535290 RepID=UPI0013EFA1E6|nr:hypothetical protein [Legionella nagasakiensis]